MKLAVYTIGSIEIDSAMHAKIEARTGHTITQTIPISRNMDASTRNSIADARNANDVHAILLHCGDQNGVIVAQTVCAVTFGLEISPLILVVDGGWDRKEQRFVYDLIGVY